MATDDVQQAWTELRQVHGSVSRAIVRALEPEGIGPAEMGALYRIATARRTPR